MQCVRVTNIPGFYCGHTTAQDHRGFHWATVQGRCSLLKLGGNGWWRAVIPIHATAPEIFAKPIEFLA